MDSLMHPFIYFLADDSVSWVSAENLWILGRYMVHLSLEEITKISPVEVSWESTLNAPLANSPGIRYIPSFSCSASQSRRPGNWTPPSTQYIWASKLPE